MEFTNTPVWDDVAIPHQPQLQGELRADACVVGLGGSGLEAAESFLLHDRSVVGIDAGRIAGGAAGRNGGFLLLGLAKFFHTTVRELGAERASAIYRATQSQMAAMKATSPHCVHQTGSLRIANDEAEYADCHEHLTALREQAFEAEHYVGAEGRGILLPTDGWFHPKEYCRQAVERILGSGNARLFEHTPAINIQEGRVETPSGAVVCDHVVVAIDGRLERVMPELQSQVTTHRLQMLATAPEEGNAFSRPTYMREGFDYVKRLPDGRIAMGGCRDMHSASEQTDSGMPTEEVQQSMEQMLRILGIQAEVTHRWAATVSYTDLLPIGFRRSQNVVCVGGYSGTGNIVGRLCAKSAVTALLENNHETLRLLTRSQGYGHRE